ncbi:uncharacterized protein PG998_005018 [Apiospora kogelbergensis]|uniref:uncharacterized protein n=1 Tax=Apiospora kogelbergensis TaxID=1337665 RepID=UPI00312CE97C
MSFDDTHNLGATGTADGVDNFLPMDDTMRERITGLATELRASLPSYMVPAVFLPLRSMLFNTSMKIDRVSLRASVEALGSGLSAYSVVQANDVEEDDGEPLTQTECKLQELWSQILKVPAESITKNTAFLQIGGDSISMIRLVNLARKEGISLEMANIFADSRLSHIAATAKIEEDMTVLQLDQFSLLPFDEVDDIVGHACEQCGFPSRDAIEDMYPCTSLQEGLMALSMKQPGSYVASFVYKMPEDVDPDRFRASWDRTVELCSNLRTRIALIGGNSIQVIAREVTGWHASTEVEASDLKSTQSALQSIPMSYGSPLCRYAIAVEPSGERYFVLGPVPGAESQVASRTGFPSYSLFIRYTLGLNLDAAASYWKAQLHGAKKTAFPAALRDTSTSVTQEFSATIEIPRAASTTITKASVLRAAWAIVLARYCDTDDVCFAVTVSGRQAPVAGLDGMAGPAIATVPVRVRLDSRQTVADFLNQIQAQASEMAAYEQYGLQRIAKVSADAREACDFANLMVIQPSQVADESDDAVLLQPAVTGAVSGEGVAGFFNYPLMAEFVLLSDDRAQLNFTFDASAVSAFQLGALSHQLNHVIGQLVAQGDQPMGTLSLTSSWDLQQAVQFSGVSKPEVARTRLESLLAEQAQRTPDSEAIFSWDGTLTYNELDAYSTKLAGHLRILGVGPHGSSREGWGAWVPLNPQHPPARLRMIMEDVSASIILVSSSTGETCQGLADRIVEVSTASLSNLPEVDETAVRPTDSTPDDVAYIIFTSGSTGKPKGIVVQQWALCSSIHCQIKEYQTGPHTRVIQFANYVFDACIADIFVALCSGGTVCVPSDAQRLQNIAGFIRDAAVNTAMGLTPSFAATIPPEECRGLTKIVLGAEAVTRETLDIWFGHAELYNTYGPTETLVMCTSYRYTSRDEAPGTIGRLFTGRAWIVEADDHHKLTPIGCVGELLIESTPMAQGYLNDKRFAVLTSKLRAALPSYMIPSSFLPLRSMLFNASMKIDRLALRASAQALGEGLSAYSSTQADNVEPSMPMELRLRELWVQVLKVPISDIKKNSEFLQIGGDSISAIRLVTLARQKGISLDIATIFQDSRLSYIATTASICEETALASLVPEPFTLLPSSEVGKITAQSREQCELLADEEIEDIYPCTALQEGLMALTNKQPGSYVASFVYRIPAEVNLDLDKFRSAWERTVELCSNLRTRIAFVGGRSVQVVVRHAEAWQVAGTPDLESALALLDSVVMGYGTSLCRATMAVGPNGDYHFALAIHHATYDGWGFQLVLQTLQAIYHGSALSELPPYSLFIKHTQGMDQDAASRYWMEQLKGAKRSGYPLIGREVNAAKSVTQTFEATISLPRSTGTSITKASILRAAWALLLARHCDLDDVCFAMTVSGRQAPVPGLDNMAGPTIATVPVRVRLSPNQSVADFLQGIQAQASNMAVYEQYGLQNISKISPDAREACDFTNLIVIQPAAAGASDDSAETILLPAESKGSSADKGLEGFFNYPLITEVVLQEDQAKLNFTFDASILSEFELHALSQQLGHVVQQLSSTRGEQPLSKVTLASSWDLEQAMKWSGEKPILTPEEVAYIIFTSGSTGKPKGIVVEHGPLCSSIRSQARHFGIAADSRVLQFSSYVFDACIADIFVTLCSGGTVCVPSDADRLQNIAGFIQEARVNTAIALTPSFVATINPNEVPTFKNLFVGAEAPTKETLSTCPSPSHP